MDLSRASLGDLVAELRERLRRFASRPPCEDASEVPPGPLGPAGRAALAARLLAVVLASRPGPEAAEAAAALEELATTLATAPAPLPGSAWEADLGLLARTLESLAGAWDEVEERRLADLWGRVREVGDRIWASTEAATSAPATEPATARTTTPVTGGATAPRPRPGGSVELWLLVAGTLRRDSLRRRLVAAGVRVRCLEGIDEILAALADAAPTAIVSDDAAPARFRSRLLAKLPASAPPVVLVRHRSGAVDPGGLVWLPPYDPRELLTRLGR